MMSMIVRGSSRDWLGQAVSVLLAVGTAACQSSTSPPSTDETQAALTCCQDPRPPDADGGVPLPCGFELSLPLRTADTIESTQYSDKHRSTHNPNGSNDWYALDIHTLATDRGLDEPIYPIAPGTVVLAGWTTTKVPTHTSTWATSDNPVNLATCANFAAYGRRVVIQHDFTEGGHTYSSIYAHLQTVTATVGQHVDVNTQIGTLGRSTCGNPDDASAHLHLAIYQDATLQDYGTVVTTDDGYLGGHSVGPIPYGAFRTGFDNKKGFLFWEAYSRFRPPSQASLGCPNAPPWSPTETKWVHEPYGHGVELQDYFQVSGGFPGLGDTALACKRSSCTPYLIRSGFWGAYKCLSVDGHSMGGPKLLGAPQEDEQAGTHGCGEASAAEIDAVQRFERGCMYHKVVDAGNLIRVHLNDHSQSVIAASECTPPAGPLVLVENPSGPTQPCPTCLNMGCASTATPTDGSRFKTPATGPGVYYKRGAYKQAFPDSWCYHLLYPDFSGLECVGDAPAGLLTDAPAVCSEGSFYRVDGDPTIFRLDGGRLRALCGAWTSASFRQAWGYGFDVAFLLDEGQFANLDSAFPVSSTGGIYPFPLDAPACGDPGFQCGDHVDPDGVCYGTLHCGGCGAGTHCVDGACVAEPLAVGPGAITSPADGATIASGATTLTWSHGISSDDSPVKSAVFCSVEGGPWEARVGFVAETSAVVSFAPGVDAQCKLRTRLETSWDEWTESEPVTWSVSGATSAMNVVAVAERPDSHPNGCDYLEIDARIRNDGALTGNWEARAYLHPALEDEHSPQAIEAPQPRWVSLAPGEEGTYTFALPTTTPLPLAAGWAVTVVVPDPQGFGPTGRATVGAAGHDAGPPQFDAFQIYGLAGAPVELVPGRVHTVQVAARDDYALDTFELAWRSDAAWNTIIAGPAYTNGCRELSGFWHSWTVPTGLPTGTLIEIRARYRDLAGNLAEEIRPARLRSSAAPSLTFIRPTTGEQHVASSVAAPRCVPFEAIVVPGVSLSSIAAGFTDAAHVARGQHTAVPVPLDGRVAGCLPALSTGDAVELYLQLRDTNGSDFMFFAGPIAVALAPPAPPWGPVHVDPDQGPPPPAPVPATQGGQAWMEYLGLRADATTVTVHRLDRASWIDPGTGVPQDRHALRRLTFALADLSPLSSSVVVNSFTEVGVATATSFRVTAYDGWPFSYDAVPVGGCIPSWSTTCDYQARVRDVVGGNPGPWRTLGTYPGLLSSEAPILFNEASSLVPSTGERFLSVLDVKQNRSTLSRLVGGAWWTVATHDPPLRIAATQGALWGFRRLVDGAGGTWVAAMTVDPITGATGAPVNLAAGTSAGYTYAVARDEAADMIVIVALDPGQNRLRVARLQGGAWTESPAQPIAATWRGHALTSRNLNGAVASGGRVRARVSVGWSGGGASLALIFRPDHPIDVERAFEDDDVGTVALAPDGRMVKTFVCRWNFEERLCLQLGHAVTAACWDGNPCTDDVWDPIAGSCTATARSCASDGDECNGPEVCDPATGVCGTDAAAAPTCDDGAWCNGVETCVAATGACAPGTAPVVDDGRSCTIDSCDEAADLIRHVPDDARCLAGHCERAACAPSAAGADVAGCVRTPVPIVADALTCTDDACDPATGDMIHPIRAGVCVIDGVCHADGALDPRGCRRCEPNADETGWTAFGDGLACDDGRYCTVGDTCAAGLCVGAARNCGPAALPCFALACSEADDACQPVIRPDGAGCDDGDSCNGVATCSAGTCIPGTLVTIDDGLVCTDDVCDPFLGALHPTNDALCDADGNGCTVDDRCAGGGCIAGPSVDCSGADDQCNVGRCASLGPGSFTCLRDPAPREGMSCDDGNLCSTGDHCAAGGCVATAHIECPPTDECHDLGSCIPASGVCSEPIPRDGTPCTGGTCIVGACVPQEDAAPIDAADANDAADADAGGSPMDAAEPDAGSDEPPEGCECRSGAPSGAGALFACVVFFVVVRRRRGMIPCRPSMFWPASRGGATARRARLRRARGAGRARRRGSRRRWRGGPSTRCRGAESWA